MNEFASCIEYLLLTHDSIVVPGLGAFITQRMPARYVEEEHLLLPPFRIVRFNQEVESLDSTLASDISALLHQSLAATEQKLSCWVVELLQALDDTGVCDFGSLGVFTMENDDDIIFTPSESGIITPGFYALDAVHIDTLQEDSDELQHTGEQTSLQREQKDGSIVIRINRQLAHFAAAACAAVLFFFLLSTPIENSEAVAFSQQAEFFIPVHLIPSASQPAAAQSTAPAVVKPVSVGADDAAGNVGQGGESEETVQTAETGYCIVVASLVSQANATRYVKDLSNRGFSSPRILEGKMRRVVIGNYQTKEAASVAASELRKSGKEFASAWVLTL